jgi:glycolate oxidase
VASSSSSSRPDVAGHTTAGERAAVVDRLRALVGAEHVRLDAEARERYGVDALRRGSLADIVVLPANTAEIAAIAKLCHDTGTPLVPRGGGTGFTGGAVPVRGGVVLSLERLNRILEIDEANLLAIVEPNVITGDLQDAVERVGLFYPPDPASLRRSAMGGNVAECAGGPRAFKYGVTRQYVLGLEVVLPTGEVIRTGGKTVKNVVGYDLTQLLVGSEGTLAIVTQIIVRLVPKPPVAATLRATFPSVRHAVEAVIEMVRARVVPSTMELIDRDSLDAVAQSLGVRSLAPEGTNALLIVEVDGLAEQVQAEATRVVQACEKAGASEVLRAGNETERQELWRVRREISQALLVIADLKFNNDIVVPKGRIPELFDLIGRLKARFNVPIPCFGHVGDGNIHVNIMVADTPDEIARAREAEAELFRGVVALEGSISGEHGIGFSKARYLDFELGPDAIALMKRIKHAFDPRGILNPGKIFPDAP